ncbi:MAG TPA: RNA polymerase sigma factor [Planctomycetaceae bacterium]|nr:RNA polymerase sigma factor [Planctomycetaceae bacterium]
MAAPEAPVSVDRELVDRCREGDPLAQRQLYEACLPRIYRLAVQLVGAQDAADVTQNVFLQAFRRLDQFQGASKFETWLYRLAVNESLQFLRRRQRRRWLPLASEPEADRDRSRSALEARELLDQALSEIDPELRAIFLLREWEQMSYEEIAESLDIPAGTVGSRLNRARKQLQSVLTRLGWRP